MNPQGWFGSFRGGRCVGDWLTVEHMSIRPLTKCCITPYFVCAVQDLHGRGVPQRTYRLLCGGVHVPARPCPLAAGVRVGPRRCRGRRTCGVCSISCATVWWIERPFPLTREKMAGWPVHSISTCFSLRYVEVIPLQEAAICSPRHAFTQGSRLG